MIVSRMKCITLGLLLFVSVLAEPGDMIANHPNCPEVQGPFPVYFEHPTNCSRFYECRHTDAWELECSAGLHFNTKIDVCDFPENAQCQSQSGSTTTFPSTTLASSTPTTTDPAVEQTTTEATTSAPTDSPTTLEISTTTTTAPVSSTTTTAAPVSSTTTTAAPVSSTTTTAAPVSSTTTTAAPVSSTTTTAAPVSSTPTSQTTTVPTSSPTYPTPEIDTTTTPYPTPTTTYYTTTTNWGDDTTTVRPPTEGSTPLPNCPPFGATQPNYWADSSDCTSYLGCLENCVQQFKCPDGLYWNDQGKRCDSFGNSQCCPVIPPAPNVWTIYT